MTEVLYEEVLRGGAMWSWRLRRGQRLRITDIEGGANFPLLAYNGDQPLERYNMSDTLKAQHTFFLSKDLACYSDMGRVLLSFVDDTVGWHDTVTGVSNAAVVEEKYGVKTYQKYRNNRHRNGSDNLLVELGKHGLGPRDLAAPINLFTKIQPDENTSLTYVADHSPAGSSVTLRADMNTLVVGTAVQHPLDPNPEYNPKSVKLEILAGEPAPQDDPCRQASDESGRAFTLTDHYFLGAP